MVTFIVALAAAKNCSLQAILEVPLKTRVSVIAILRNFIRAQHLKYSLWARGGGPYNV